MRLDAGLDEGVPDRARRSGFVMDPVIGPAMAGAIAWLLSSVEGMPVRLSDYHMFGYDITHIPRPPDAESRADHSMFNFRAVFTREPDQTVGMLDAARAVPLPEWRPPPQRRIERTLNGCWYERPLPNYRAR
jgi:hypothetical protein